MMDSVKQFTVGDVTYSVARASAIDQDAILSLLTSPITERWAVLRQRGDVSDVESMIMPMFMAMPQSIKQPVSGMLMKKAFIAGEQSAVDIKAFSGRMVEYNTLLAKILIWNLDDFFTWLAGVSESKENQESQQQ